MLDREPLSDGRIRLTFSLPAQDPPGEVSVVGSFNDWRAGHHTLQPSAEGTRRVSVTVEPGSHHFRYLATNDRWGDEPDADVVNEHGSVVHCVPSEVSSPPVAGSVQAGNGSEPAAGRAAAQVEATPAKAAPAKSGQARTAAARAGTGQARTAQSRTGQAEAGPGGTGQTEAGQAKAEAGQAEAGQAEAGQAGTTEATGTESGATEQERPKPQPAKAGKVTARASGRRAGKGTPRQPAR